MIPYFVFDHIKLGPVTIYTWGLFVALGFIIGILVALKEAKRKGVDQNQVLNLAVVLFFSAFIGTRLLFVALFWNYFSKNLLEIFQIWKGGMVYYGGLIGLIIGGAVYVKIKKLDFWQMADIFSLGAPLGLAIGRLGCFSIHDHLGPIMSRPWPWGIKYFDGVRHETALYSIIMNLLIFGMLLFLRKKNSFRGSSFLCLLLFYSVGRFMVDIFRAVDLPQSDPRFIGLTVSQYISLVLFFGASILLLRKNRKFSKSKERKTF